MRLSSYISSTTFLLFLFPYPSSSFTCPRRSFITSKPTALKACPEKQNQPITNHNDLFSSHHMNRRNVFQKAAAAVATITSITLLSKQEPSQAFVPTIDDYQKTSTGAKIKPTSIAEASDEILSKLSLRTPIETKQSLQSFAESCLESLTALDGVVESADWGGVRSVLRGEGRYEKDVLSMVRKPFFGIKGGEKGLKKLLGDGVNVKELEEAREDLAFRLAELEDFALSNRSIFFNTMDKQQVSELIAETGYEEKTSEGKELFSVAKDQAMEFRNFVINQ